MKPMKRRNRERREAGVTLIEMLVVVMIIGLFAALVGPQIFKQGDKARITAAHAQINSFMTALGSFKLDTGVFPSTEQGLQALVKKPTIAPEPSNWKGNGYLERLPNDPWKNPYQYLQPGLHGEFDVMSMGADGAAGGEGNDADIGSWEL